MNLNITFRHLEANDAVKAYANDKVGRVNRYLDKASEAHVVISQERHLRCADFRIQSGSFLIRGQARSEDVYAAIDLAMNKIERQLKRYKDKLKSTHGMESVRHSNGSHGEAGEEVSVWQRGVEGGLGVEEGSRKIVREKAFLASPMSLEEAIMHMDLMDNDFLVFTNSTTMEMNVVYNRPDETIGLIEASGVQRVSLGKHSH